MAGHVILTSCHHCGKNEGLSVVSVSSDARACTDIQVPHLHVFAACADCRQRIWTREPDHADSPVTVKELLAQAENMLRVAEDLTEDHGDARAFRIMHRRWLVDFGEVVDHGTYERGVVVEAKDPMSAARLAWKEWTEAWGDDGDWGNIEGPVKVYLEPEGLMSGGVPDDRYEIGEDWENGWRYDVDPTVFQFSEVLANVTP